METIRLGLVSDPPDIPLYVELGKDKEGLTLYRCCRGTNSVEGGVHHNLRARFRPFGASPRLAGALLKDYVLHHNLVVSRQLFIYHVFL
jgi:hypothetical protein